MGVKAWPTGTKNKPISESYKRDASKGQGAVPTTLQFLIERVTSRKSKLLVIAAVFAFLVGPTFISYKPYLFQWDDSGKIHNGQSSLLVME